MMCTLMTSIWLQCSDSLNIFMITNQTFVDRFKFREATHLLLHSCTQLTSDSPGQYIKWLGNRFEAHPLPNSSDFGCASMVGNF